MNQSCTKCKTTLPKSEFNGKKICPKCIGKLQAGKEKKAAMEAEQKALEAEADDKFLIKEEPVKKSRPKRTPLTNRRVLEYNGDDNYTYRVFNDRPGRLEEAQEAGWEMVKDSNPNALSDGLEGRRIPGSVVAKPVGGGVTGYLMRKPKDEFEEDMAIVEERAMMQERSITEGQEDPSFYTKKDMPIRVTTGKSLHNKQMKRIE